MDRREMIESLIEVSGQGLEIGPSYAPLFPKSAGYNIDIADYLDRKGLIDKYKTMPNVDVSRIEAVDYILDGRPIHEVITKRQHYDFIFSSHVIEHVPDFILYLKSCELLLRPGGRVAFAIPDKRYTFDVFQRITSTGEIIQAYLEKRTRHPAGSVYDFFANFATLDGRIAWDADDKGAVTLVDTIANACSRLQEAISSPQYTDVHTWFFTPSSFRLILHDLMEAGYTRLAEAKIINYGGFEFFAALGIDADSQRSSRNDLLKAVAIDQMASLTQLLS